MHSWICNLNFAIIQQDKDQTWCCDIVCLLHCQAAGTRKCLFCVAQQLGHFLRPFLSTYLRSVPLLSVRGATGNLGGLSHLRWRVGAADAIATTCLEGEPRQGLGTQIKGAVHKLCMTQLTEFYLSCQAPFIAYGEKQIFYGAVHFCYFRHLLEEG